MKKQIYISLANLLLPISLMATPVTNLKSSALDTAKVQPDDHPIEYCTATCPNGVNCDAEGHHVHCSQTAHYISCEAWANGKYSASQGHCD